MVGNFLDRFVTGVGVWLFLVIYCALGNAMSNDYFSIYQLPFFRSIEYLFLPALVFIVFMYVFCIRKTRLHYGNVKVFIYALLFLVALLVFSSGYVLKYNALVGKQQDYFFRGVVIDRYSKSIQKSSRRLYVLKIKDELSSEVVQLSVPRGEYERYKVNAMYSERWFLGAAGLVYK